MAEWERIIPDLAEMGVLSRADRPALAAYCTAWSRWVEAEGMVKKYGLGVEPLGRFGFSALHRS